MRSEDFHKTPPITPQSYQENKKFHFNPHQECHLETDLDINNVTNALPYQSDIPPENTRMLKPMQEKEVNPSADMSLNDLQPAIVSHSQDKKRMYINDNPGNFFYATKRQSRPFKRSTSKQKSDSDSMKLWHNKMKDFNFLKPNLKKSQVYFNEAPMTIKKPRIEACRNQKESTHSVHKRITKAIETPQDLKNDQRLSEFKLLKESFLNSVFSKSKEDQRKPPPKPIKSARPHTEDSFEKHSSKNNHEFDCLKAIRQKEMSFLQNQKIL
jgi:hypothetical protein